MSESEIGMLLEQLFMQARIQFGSAIRSRWLYDRDGCPGCRCEINAMKYKGKDALSLNAFIYRDHGVLIAYLLCGKCAGYILKESKKDSRKPTDLHAKIESNLKKAYSRPTGH